jgi:hypothetical protein
MRYDSICNSIMEVLLNEKLQRSYLTDINTEIKNLIDREKKSGNFEVLKKHLKNIKKRFIAKLIQEDYNSILSTHFPQLKKDKGLPDNVFARKLFNPDNWMFQSVQQEKALFNSLEKALKFYAGRDYQEFSNLGYLRGDYLPSTPKI